jgi:hypothetical protein
MIWKSSGNILLSLSKDNLFVVSVEMTLGEYKLQNCYNCSLFPMVIKIQENYPKVVYLIIHICISTYIILQYQNIHIPL